MVSFISTLLWGLITGKQQMFHILPLKKLIEQILYMCSYLYIICNLTKIIIKKNH